MLCVSVLQGFSKHISASCLDAFSDAVGGGGGSSVVMSRYLLVWFCRKKMQNKQNKKEKNQVFSYILDLQMR